MTDYKKSSAAYLNTFNYLFKFLLIGDVNIGKSAIINQYVNYKFLQDYQPTIGVEFGSKTIDIEGILLNKIMQLKYKFGILQAKNHLNLSLDNTIEGHLLLFQFMI